MLAEPITVLTWFFMILKKLFAAAFQSNSDLIKTCLQHAEAKRWDDVLSLTADPALMKNVRLLTMRLQAAIAADAQDVLEDLVRQIPALELQDHNKLVLLRELASSDHLRHAVIGMQFLMDDTALHANPKVHTAILRFCMLFAAENRWHEVLQLTADKTLMEDLRLLTWRLQAAVALDAREAVQEIAAVIVEQPFPEMNKFALLRQFASSNHIEHAVIGAQVLIGHKILHDDPKVVKSINRFTNALSGSNFRDEIAQLKKLELAISKGGKDIKPQPSAYSFAAQPPPAEFGTVQVIASGQTPPHHVAALLGEARIFEASVSVPERAEVFELNDVFIDHGGQIWTEKGEIIVSRGHPVEVTDRSSVEQIPKAFSGTRDTRGIYHWLIDYLPKFAWLPASGLLDDASFRILLNAANSKFESDVLDIVQMGASVQKISKPVFVQKLFLATVGFRRMTGWSHLDPVYAALATYAREITLTQGSDMPSRIYITRRDAARRVLVNELEVENLARAQGFVVMEFSSIPVAQQVAIVANADVVMSPHGAGLSHIVFSRPGTQIIEILPIMDGSYRLRFNYARLSIIKGHRYSAWLEPQRPGKDKWTVDLAAFSDFLNKTLAARAVTV